MKTQPFIAQFLENYFDKIFVLTIPRATDRHMAVKKQLEGLNFDFFYGVDKQMLDMQELVRENIYNEARAKKMHRHHKGMIIGYIACALSHRMLCQHVVEKGYKRVLIFEDDVMTVHEHLHLLPQAIRELPEDWEMVYFGYAKNEVITSKLKLKQLFYKILSYAGLHKWTPLMVNNILPRLYSPHLKRAGSHDLLHAIGLSGEACKKLVAAQTPIAFHADSLITHLIMNGELNAYITDPQFFIQTFTEPSYIHQ